MIGRNDISPMPCHLDIRCPQCGERANFECAEVCIIQRKADIPYFDDSPYFDYRYGADAIGQLRHEAVYYPGLHGEPQETLQDLPDGYLPDNWEHAPTGWAQSGMNEGSVCCAHCQWRGVHRLDWPNDAYFAVPYQRQILWAFNRDATVELRHYLAAEERDERLYRYSQFLGLLSSDFKSHQARAPLCRRLSRLLREA